jgi:hypothetical protein
MAVSEPGNFLMSEFEIVDIQRDVLEHADITVTKQVDSYKCDNRW